MSRERFLRLLLVVVSCLAALGILELACRVIGVGSPNPHLTEETGLFVPVSDPEISYRLKPGFERSVYGTSVRINSRGLRESESVDYGAHEGVFRILCLGDSVVFGFGVPQERSFPAAMEALLNSRGEIRFQVVNTGVPGYNTVQEVRFLEVEGCRYLPDLVLLSLVINDPEGVRSLDSEGHLLPVAEDIWLRLFREYGSLGAPDSASHLYNGLYRALMPLSSRYRRMVQEAVEYQTEEIFTHPGWQACQQALVRLREWGDAHERPVVPVILPVLTDFKNHPYLASYQRLADACRESGLDPIEAWPALQQHDPDDLRVHPMDGHPGVYGHRVIAQFLFEELSRRSYWRPQHE
ncbi:MAG: GDSL-type esterase/lipase family protein [bacterium]